MKGNFLFLGSGGSLGIPVVGCSCPVCTSSSPFNCRLRPSGLIQVAGLNLLLDAGPDFRLQALKQGIKHIDGLLLTHTHFDHAGGFDELRAFSFKGPEKIPCLLSRDALKDLQIRYYYLMHEGEDGTVASSKFDFTLLPQDFGSISFLGLPIRYVSYFQAGMRVTGFQLGDLAYISDIRDYTEEVIHRLKGVKRLIVSALRHDKSEVHFNISEALAFSQAVGAQDTWLTHLTHDLDHEETNRSLPPNIRLSYDGLQIPFSL